MRYNYKTFRVHRIILESFMINDDPETLTCVDHLNGIRDDNRLNNLRFCTAKDNYSNRHPGIYREQDK